MWAREMKQIKFDEHIKRKKTLREPDLRRV